MNNQMKNKITLDMELKMLDMIKQTGEVSFNNDGNTLKDREMQIIYKLINDKKVEVICEEGNNRVILSKYGELMLFYNKNMDEIINFYCLMKNIGFYINFDIFDNFLFTQDLSLESGNILRYDNWCTYISSLGDNQEESNIKHKGLFKSIYINKYAN